MLQILALAASQSVKSVFRVTSHIWSWATRWFRPGRKLTDLIRQPQTFFSPTFPPFCYQKKYAMAGNFSHWVLCFDAMHFLSVEPLFELLILHNSMLTFISIRSHLRPSMPGKVSRAEGPVGLDPISIELAILHYCYLQSVQAKFPTLQISDFD